MQPRFSKTKKKLYDGSRNENIANATSFIKIIKIIKVIKVKNKRNVRIILYLYRIYLNPDFNVKKFYYLIINFIYLILINNLEV